MCTIYTIIQKLNTTLYFLETETTLSTSECVDDDNETNNTTALLSVVAKELGRWTG